MQVQPLQQQQQGPWKADGFRINHALCCSSSFTVASVSMQADLMLTFERDGTIHIQVGLDGKLLMPLHADACI